MNLVVVKTQVTLNQGIKRKCDHVGKVSSYIWDKENCNAQINKSSMLHELKFSEVAEKFNVRNKNGTFQNLSITQFLPNTQIIHLTKTIICKHLEAPRNTSKHPFQMETILSGQLPLGYLKHKITFSLFTVIPN